jgi:hypothetical protein
LLDIPAAQFGSSVSMGLPLHFSLKKWRCEMSKFPADDRRAWSRMHVPRVPKPLHAQ